jgi:hypothetical protein
VSKSHKADRYDTGDYDEDCNRRGRRRARQLLDNLDVIIARDTDEGDWVIVDNEPEEIYEDDSPIREKKAEKEKKKFFNRRVTDKRSFLDGE